jgi:serine/threonine protein kinase
LSFFSQPEGVNKGLGTPLSYAAPEVIFDDPLKTSACDVWSLGCLLYRVLGDLDLWVMIWNQAEIFPNLMTALGRFPDRWWQQWDAEERSKYFDDEGHPVPEIRNWGGPIDRRVNELTDELEGNVKELGENEISPVHLDELKHILLAIFKWEPEERVDARAVFQAVAWVQEYAEECALLLNPLADARSMAAPP